MARYDYYCLACKEAAEEIKGAPLTRDEEWEVIYETSHPMEPTKKELKAALVCPRCGSNKAERCYRNINAICYIRGNGYLDRAGCHRDMNLHKLVNDDPYAEMREPGEAEDLKLRLQRGGQHNPRTRYFVPGSSDERSEESDVDSSDDTT